MSDNIASQSRSAWPLKFTKWGGWLILVGIVLAVLSGPFNRLGLTGFFGPLLAFLVGYLLMAIGLVLALVGYVAANARKLRFDRSRTLLGLLAALVVGGYVTSIVLGSRGLPPIHEISTDLESPPAFVAVRAIREQNPKVNPSDYVSELKNPQTGAVMNVPELQRQAYPDIQPVVLADSPDKVFAAVDKAIADLGWDRVAAVPAEGRIEATDTTRFFGFKDDIVVRIRAEGSGTRVDIRSKSRVGLGDAGANAKRVRALIAKLKA